MRIMTSDVQMDAVSQRKDQYEVRRERSTEQGRSVQQNNVQQNGNRQTNQDASQATVLIPSTVVGISSDARVEYEQTYQQYSHRNSDVYRFDGANTSGVQVTQYSDSSFIEAAISSIFRGQHAAVMVGAPRPIPGVVNTVLNANELNANVLDIGHALDIGNAQPINLVSGSEFPEPVVSEPDFSQSRIPESRISQSNITLVDQTQVSSNLNGGVAVAGVGLMRVSEYTFSHTEQSQMFNGHGTVTTEDGRVINFGMFLAMERSETIESESELLIRRGGMTDPLVINFGSETATLTDQFFEFDLDSDGSDEQIASLGKGSGYLMLDRNGNGQVDDGSELFGPETGKGFAELAEYDSDGNRWIDEGDPIFSQLQVWVDTEDGEGKLLSLSEVGVGAIYLGSAEADFDLVGADGIPLGRIKANGLFLTESGEVRSVQELDLATSRTSALGSPEVMTEQQMDARVRAENLEVEVTDDSAEGGSRPIISDISHAIERMNELRESQKAFGESLVDDEESKSLLSQLVASLEASLENSRKAQLEDQTDDD